MTAAQLIDRLVAQFDTSRADALLILNAVHKRMVADSMWRSSTVSLGNTVADTGEYALPSDVVNLRAVRIVDGEGNTTIYDPASIAEVWSLDAGDGSLDGAVFAEDASTAGVTRIALRPVPDTGGLAITGLQALEPADLTDGANAPIVPDDFHLSGIYEGMLSVAYSQIEERDDQAAPHEAIFQGEIVRLAARKVSRVGGGNSVSRMRVAGYDFQI